jgi:hypothetical protein
MRENQTCSCPHCEVKFKKSCFGAKFCKSCSIQEYKYKICYACKAKYLSEYDKCPACMVNKNLF